MEEDFPLIPFHSELVFNQEFMELLLFDLCHNVFGFLWKETAQSCEEPQTPDNLTIHTFQHGFKRRPWKSKRLKDSLYREREVDAVIQIPEPEEVGEPVRDVKRTEFLIAQIQKSQDTYVVLIAPVNIVNKVLCLRVSGTNKA